MRKMKTFFSAILFLLVVVQFLDAAPRRRRSRRSNQQYTRATTNHTTTYTQPQTQPQAYQTAQAQQYRTIQSTPVQQQASSTYAVAFASPNELPTVPEVQSQGEVVVASSTMAAEPGTIAQVTYQEGAIPVAQPAVTATGVMAEVNAIRARSGLPGFAEDPSLSAVAYQKASIQANRGAMGHPGGSMGGARYEGVGMGNQFTTCYLYTTAGTTAGAASVRGPNGQRYHCLLVK